MNFQRKLCTALGISIFVAAPLILFAYQEGPDPRLTAAPGEDSLACASCHLGNGNPTTGSGVTVAFPNGLSYTPGVKQTLTVSVTPQPGNRPNGFELSIRPQINANVQAGDLTPTDATQIVCQDTKPSKPCNAAFPVQFIEQSFTGSTIGPTWTFDWTPPATDVGNIRVYVAGNAGNGNGENSGDKIYLNSYTLAPQASTPPAPKLSATAPVIEAFQGGARLSPGAWIEINGTNLAPSSKDWTTLLANNTAPTTINGVSVNVGGKAAFLSLTSPELIKAQVPDGIGIGSLPVEVVTDGGRVSTNVNAATVAPALLTASAFNVGGKQYVAAVFPEHPENPTYVGPIGAFTGKDSRPAKAGDIIVIYAVGCGTNEGGAAGTVVSGLHAINNVKVMFDQAVANATAYLTPGSIGLCQFNVTVPSSLGAGDHDITASINEVLNGQGLKITTQ